MQAYTLLVYTLFVGGHVLSGAWGWGGVCRQEMRSGSNRDLEERTTDAGKDKYGNEEWSPAADAAALALSPAAAAALAVALSPVRNNQTMPCIFKDTWVCMEVVEEWRNWSSKEPSYSF